MRTIAELPLTHERLLQVLDYDSEAGLFWWKPPRRQPKRGKPAGCLCPDGYIRIMVDGVSYAAHQLAWLHYYGEWPGCIIDHRSTVRSENWISNLRRSTTSLNAQNVREAKATNSSGLLGASKRSDRAGWSASIMVNGKSHYLGTFKTPEMAHQVYVVAKRKLHEGSTV